MARLTLDLPTDVSLALCRLAYEVGAEREDAAIKLLREALIAGGWLEVVEMDEATEVAGSG